MVYIYTALANPVNQLLMSEQICPLVLGPMPCADPVMPDTSC